MPRESKNAGSIYNVSNSVRKCHKKLTRVGRFEGDNWVERVIQNGSDGVDLMGHTEIYGWL